MRLCRQRWREPFPLYAVGRRMIHSFGFVSIRFDRVSHAKQCLGIAIGPTMQWRQNGCQSRRLPLMFLRYMIWSV